MNKGGYGYCTHSWNPMVGCDRKKISAGCSGCWAERMAVRQKYRASVLDPDDNKWTGNIVHFPIMLNEPLKLKKPAIIAVNFMGDMFSGEADFEFIERIWDIIFDVYCDGDKHIFLILTKRPKRMLEFCQWLYEKRSWTQFHPNIHFGASASNQEDLERILPTMLELADNGAHTWLSLEPLLGPLNLKSLRNVRAVGQVIIGGESGSQPRPMNEEWASEIIYHCQAAEVPVYMKQMAGKAEIPEHLNIKELAW